MQKLLIFTFSFFIAASSALKWLNPRPENKVLIEGDSMIIYCTAADTSSYPTITYSRKDTLFGHFNPVKSDERIKILPLTHRNDTDAGLYVTKSVLKFTKVNMSDDNSKGQWHCVSNTSSEVKQMGFALWIISKNHLPQGVVHGGGTVTYGDKTNLTCAVRDGLQHYAQLVGLYWMKNNEVIKNSSSANILESLIIEKTTTSDSGQYQCVGIARLKMLENRKMVLDSTRLEVKPRIENGTTNVTVSESRKVVMDCPADGSPLNVTWWKEDEEGERQQIANSERYLITRPCSTCRYRLTITNIQPSDQGIYVCVAHGEMTSGEHEFNFYLEIPDKKPSPESSAVALSTQTSLVLLTGLVAWLTN